MVGEWWFVEHDWDNLPSKKDLVTRAAFLPPCAQRSAP